MFPGNAHPHGAFRNGGKITLAISHPATRSRQASDLSKNLRSISRGIAGESPTQRRKVHLFPDGRPDQPHHGHDRYRPYRSGNGSPCCRHVKTCSGIASAHTVAPDDPLPRTAAGSGDIISRHLGVDVLGFAESRRRFHSSPGGRPKLPLPITLQDARPFMAFNLAKTQTQVKAARGVLVIDSQA